MEKTCGIHIHRSVACRNEGPILLREEAGCLCGEMTSPCGFTAEGALTSPLAVLPCALIDIYRCDANGYVQLILTSFFYCSVDLLLYCSCDFTIEALMK